MSNSALIKATKMKIGIYTISKNESIHVDRFMDSVGEADGVFVADTGSTDDTVSKLQARGAIVSNITVSPWRFDVARNISLDLVPGDFDVVISVDLDEVLTPGWRDAIEAVFAEGDVDRLRYQYAWSHNPDGSPGVTFWYDKCHSRHGYRWVKPVHEILQLEAGRTERIKYSDKFWLHHWPDSTKSRSSYLGLLELAVKEEPHDDRSAHYLGREYMFWSHYDKAIAELKRHLSLPSATWGAERAASMRFISRCYLAKGERAEAINWLHRACGEAPEDREPWLELAKAYHQVNDHVGTYYAATNGLRITERKLSYISDPEAWGHTLHDLAGISAYYLGSYQDSVDQTTKALSFLPGNERLVKNLQFALDKL